MKENFEKDFQSLEQDWRAVGGYSFEAMQEVAAELEGEHVAAKIAELAKSDDVLPDPAALKMLEEMKPGSGEIVMQRMKKLQREAHERENKLANQSALRKYGRAIISGFKNF
jgi:hypothetical protein